MEEKLKTLDIHRFDELDSLTEDNVSEFLEQNVCKQSIECRNWEEKFPYHPVTVFSIAYSQKYLYIDFFVRGNYLRAVNYTNNTPVSQDSCVECFLQICGQKKYWNFEFNCIGTVNASSRETRDKPTRLTDAQIESIKRYASCGTRPFEEMEGLFAWNLVVKIPFELLGINPDDKPSLRGNFYKCGDKTSIPHYLSWNPIDTPKPNFHCPEFFGNLNLI